MAQIAAKNRIPIISPLMSESDIVASNPSFYQLIPSRDYIAEKTAEMVGEEFYDSNFIILKMGDYEGTKEGNFVPLDDSERATNVDSYRITCIDFIKDISKDYLAWVDRYKLPEEEDRKRRTEISAIIERTDEWMIMKTRYARPENYMGRDISIEVLNQKA